MNEEVINSSEDPRLTSQIDDSYKESKGVAEKAISKWAPGKRESGRRHRHY